MVRVVPAIFDIFNLHFLSSNIPLRNSTNNKMAFSPFITSKDFYGKILILDLYLLQIPAGLSPRFAPTRVASARVAPARVAPTRVALSGCPARVAPARVARQDGQGCPRHF